MLGQGLDSLLLLLRITLAQILPPSPLALPETRRKVLGALSRSLGWNILEYKYLVCMLLPVSAPD